MSEILFKELSVGNISFKGQENIPVWGITHFLEKTCLNHMKLTIIQRICELKSIGVPDEDFVVVANSAEIYPKKSFSDTIYTDTIRFSRKNDSAEEFWHIIGNYKRPIVLYNYNNQQIPLYDFSYSESARVTKLIEKSPLEGVIKGAIGGLLDLFYANEREERKRNAYLNEQLAQNARNINEIAKASQIINSPNTPEGVKKYSKKQLRKIMKAQNKLNKEMGIEIDSIDLHR